LKEHPARPRHMAHALIDIAVRHIRALAEEHALAAAADGELLARFADRREEAAFAVLLRRHGPMVLGVCRRVLKRHHDAEDVFQAAFLLLARKASSIRKRASLGCWLHGVAHRLAVKMKAQAERRRSHEARAGALRQSAATGQSPRFAEDLLDEALRRLPEHYRTALVLCHLEGRTHEEAARQLGCPLATLRSRLMRGRKRLRAELTRRGLVLDAGAEGDALMANRADAVLPAFLVGTTLKAAVHFAAGGTAAGAVPAALAEGSLKAMAMMKMKIVILLITALGLAAGAGAIACQAFAVKPAPEAPPTAKRQAEPPQKNEPQVRLDDDGDPLPDGAVRRVGTRRFRHGGGQVNTLLVCPDGKTLISGTFLGDRKIRTWDLTTGKLLHSFPGSFEFHQIALSPDGTTLAESHENDVISLWEVATGKESRRLEWKDCQPYGFAFSPDGKTLVSGEGDFIDFWDLEKGTHTERRKTAHNSINQLAYSPDGKTLATGGRLEDEIVLWDVKSGKEIRRLKLPGFVYPFAFTPDGAFLATATNGPKASIRLWDVDTGKVVHETPAAILISGAAFSPDGKTLASAEFGDVHVEIVFREVSSGKRLRTIDDAGLALLVAFSTDGKTLISGDPYGVIRLWDAATGKERTPPGNHAIRDATLSPDGRTLAYAQDGVRFWDMAAGRESGGLPSESNRNWSPTFSPDGKTLASLNGYEFNLWDVGSRKLLRQTKEKDEHGFSAVAFAPDGKTLASGGADGVRLWDSASGKELRRVPFQKDPSEKGRNVAPNALAFSPDGRTLAASGATFAIAASRVRLWDVASEEQIPPLLWEIETPSEENQPPTGSLWNMTVPTKVVFSPKGHMLAMNRYQKTIPVREAATGKPRLFLTGHSETTNCVAFAPDGRTLASAGWDDTIRLWNLDTGEELRTLRGHRGTANSLVFSADGKTLVSTGDDTTMLFWDVAEVTQRPRPKVVALSPEECKSLWTDLAGADAAKAYKAIRAFSAAPGQTVSFMGERLRPARSAGKEEVDRLIADLDSDDFQIREKATRALDELGDTVGPALRKVIAGQPSAEVRSRADRLLEKLATPAPQLLRSLRALEVLEAVGGPEALQVVERIANGAAEARLTRDAKAALARLDVSRKR
jgi:RNA polymerase sigma factor (sigma-70 family)